MPMHDWTRVEPGIYHDFHTTWLTTIRNALNHGLMPESHYALVEQITAHIRADVLTLERPTPAGTPATNGVHRQSAAASPESGTVTTAVRRRPRTQKLVSVRHISDHRVVAVIELVPPGNTKSRRDLRAFVDKSVDLLMGGVHVLIVNPFAPGAICRTGLHPPVWNRVARRRKGAPEYAPPVGKPLEALSYASGDDVTAVVQPFAVGDPVPAAPLFLAPDWHVSVPLDGAYQAAFAEVPAVWRAALGG